MAQRKETKKKIKVRDLKPKKDAKGGRFAAPTGDKNPTGPGQSPTGPQKGGGIEQDGYRMSSKRYKEEINPMDRASEAILALKPVTFRYKKEIDPDGGPQFGLVAEEVEKVNPDLVVREADGKVHAVRYEAVNAMLLNE